MIYKKFEEAKKLIQEGDVLLFKGKGVVSYLIQRASDGKYSHVALASWVQNGDPILECIEFKEFKGGRSVNLKTQVKESSGLIDIYRVIPEFQTLNLENGHVIEHEHKFNGRLVTDCLRRMTGLPYGWCRIWWLFQFHAIGFRLFAKGKSFDDSLQDELIYPVFSTVVAHCIQKHYIDIVHNRSNERTEPSDLARSPLLNYLFTLINDE